MHKEIIDIDTRSYTRVRITDEKCICLISNINTPKKPYLQCVIYKDGSLRVNPLGETVYKTIEDFIRFVFLIRLMYDMAVIYKFLPENTLDRFTEIFEVYNFRNDHH